MRSALNRCLPILLILGACVSSAAAMASLNLDVQNQYRPGQERLDTHISTMKSAGKSTEAEDVTTRLRTTEANQGASERLDAAMQAGLNALMANRPDEGEKNYTEAVDLAEKIQPHDMRLTTSLLRLGAIYAGKQDFPLAEATLTRALKVTEEVYGSDSPMMTEPLQALGRFALMKKDYSTALDLLSRAVEVNEKTFGENSDNVAKSLLSLAIVPYMQQAYDKTELYLLRAVRIDESLFGKDGLYTLVPLASLCNLYEKWDKPEKAEPCYRQTLAALDKHNGADSPIMLDTLTKEASVLRRLGRSEEAVQIEQRLQSTRASQTNAN
jgi:tetratricopeptide (TPR) repeat protein